MRQISKLLFLVVALFVVSCQQNVKKEDSTSNTPSTLDVIHQRKSVRSYAAKEVSKEQLETLVRAGMAAPSARNLQPWAFVAITERAVLDEMAKGLPYAKMLLDAPAAIIVCGDLQKAATDVDRNFWVQDCSAATQNILLAAESIGLGAVWTAAFPYQDRMDAVIKALELPEHILPLNVIPIGYPATNEQPKDKWNPENLHWEKW